MADLAELDRILGLIQEQQRHGQARNVLDRGTALFIGWKLLHMLEALSDAQLGHLLFEIVWARSNVLAPENPIVFIAAKRLSGDEWERGGEPLIESAGGTND